MEVNQTILDVDAGAPLHICSTIDLAEIDRLETALAESFFQRLLEDRRQRMRRAERTFKLQPKIVLWLSVAGFVVALIVAMAGGLPYQGYRLELLFAVFFAATGALSFMLPRSHLWIVEPWLPFWRTIARIHATSLLKAARKAVPFDAEYTFDGDSVTYFRTAGGIKKIMWQRPLRGARDSGPGFTLLLKHERAISPTLIILHQPSAEMDAWLERLAPRIVQAT
jgi:hypothetical protein